MGNKDEYKKCPLCGGTGEVASQTSSFVVFEECSMCKGEKMILKK